LSVRSTPPPGPEPYALARYTRPSATCGWISNVPWPFAEQMAVDPDLLAGAGIQREDHCP